MTAQPDQLRFHADRSREAGNHATAIFCQEAADEIERQKDRIEALEVAGMNGQQTVSYLAEQLQELRVMYGALEGERDRLAARLAERDNITREG